MLIEKKSDVNTKVSFKTDGLYLKDFTPLTFNVDTEVAELFIEAGADLNAKDKDGNTALYYAITKNNSKITKLISDKGGRF
ncbi:ankyrin repeat domain-containing protein [uncultured Brachyspira sp.]|nr:ankyrin repeat domain-containing protein [uncultured Brachyspira sp.]